MRAIFLILMPLFIGTGCTHSGPYRIDTTKPCVLQTGEGDLWNHVADREAQMCPSSAVVRVQGTSNYDLNYVEIDDQGVLTSRRQAELVLENIGAAPAKGRVITIVFVHGWNHNAQADDENVRRFHLALGALSRWHPTDTVRGVYIGWRGASIAVPVLNMLTFWDRKNTSDEVGRGGLFEFLLRLERVAKPTRDSANRLVLVGHSFGASVTFNALASLHMTRFIEGLNDRGSGKRFRGYGDLVVLINPAIEGMRFMPFRSALEYYSDPKHGSPLRADFSNESNPILIVLSSLGDWATRVTFSAARVFTTALEVHRRTSIMGSADNDGPFSEWNMDRLALGNVVEFQSHKTLGLAIDKKEAEEKVRRDGCSALPDGELKKVVRQESYSFPHSEIILTRKPEGAYTPYWLMDVHEDIIAGHSDFQSPMLLCWLNQVVESR